MFKKFPRLFFIANKTCDFTIKKLLKVANKEKIVRPLVVLVVSCLPTTVRLPRYLFRRVNFINKSLS